MKTLHSYNKKHLTRGFILRKGANEDFCIIVGKFSFLNNVYLIRKHESLVPPPIVYENENAVIYEADLASVTIKGVPSLVFKKGEPETSCDLLLHIEQAVSVQGTDIFIQKEVSYTKDASGYLVKIFQGGELQLTVEDQSDDGDDDGLFHIQIKNHLASRSDNPITITKKVQEYGCTYIIT